MPEFSQKTTSWIKSNLRDLQEFASELPKKELNNNLAALLIRQAIKRLNAELSKRKGLGVKLG